MEQSENNSQEGFVTYYTRFPGLIPTPVPTPKRSKLSKENKLAMEKGNMYNADGGIDV